MQPSYYNSIWVDGLCAGRHGGSAAGGAEQRVERDRAGHHRGGAIHGSQPHPQPQADRRGRRVADGDLGRATAHGQLGDRGLRGATSAGWRGLGQRVPTGARHLRAGDQPHGHGSHQRQRNTTSGSRPVTSQSALLALVGTRWGSVTPPSAAAPRRRPPPPPVNKPGPVQALTLTPGDHELGVRWRGALKQRRARHYPLPGAVQASGRDGVDHQP